MLLTLSPALEVDEDEEQVLNSGACSDDRLHPDKDSSLDSDATVTVTVSGNIDEVASPCKYFPLSKVASFPSSGGLASLYSVLKLILIVHKVAIINIPLSFFS